MNLSDRIEIRQDGRSGEIRVRFEQGWHDFWWEFGGGQCIAFINVPNEERWSRIPLLSTHPRAAFLQSLAHEVGRRQCPSARIEIGADSISFMS